MEKRGGKRSGLKGAGKISRRSSSGIGKSSDDKKPISNPNSKRSSRRDAVEEEKDKKPFKKFEKKPFEKKKFDRSSKVSDKKELRTIASKPRFKDESSGEERVRRPRLKGAPSEGRHAPTSKKRTELRFMKRD